jgi:hypothetical protein
MFLQEILFEKIGISPRAKMLPPRAVHMRYMESPRALVSNT